VRDTEEGKQSFFNDWLALRFSAHARQQKWTTLGRRLQFSHQRGTVPAQALFLTCGVDVQLAESIWIIRAWGDGGTSWLVDWGDFRARVDGRGEAISGSQLEPLTEIFGRSWPVAGGRNPLGLWEMTISKAGVDCGFLPRIVDGYVRSLRDARVCLVRGLSSPGELPYRQMKTDDGMRYIGINTATYKADINDRWTLPADKPGAWFVPSLPDLSIAERYLRQLTNEVRRVVINPKTNHSNEQWVLVDHGLRSDYLDTEVYSAALADIVAQRDWTNLLERLQQCKAAVREQSQQPNTFLQHQRRKGWIR